MWVIKWKFDWNMIFHYVLGRYHCHQVCLGRSCNYLLTISISVWNVNAFQNYYHIECKLTSRLSEIDLAAGVSNPSLHLKYVSFAQHILMLQERVWATERIETIKWERARASREMGKTKLRIANYIESEIILKTMSRRLLVVANLVSCVIQYVESIITYAFSFTDHVRNKLEAAAQLVHKHTISKQYWTVRVVFSLPLNSQRRSAYKKKNGIIITELGCECIRNE